MAPWCTFYLWVEVVSAQVCISYLHAVYGQAGSRVQLLVTYVTLEMFGFLMLYENLLIVEVSVAVPLCNWIKVFNL